MAKQKQNPISYGNRERSLPISTTMVNVTTEPSSLLPESSSAQYLIPQRMKRSNSIPIQNQMKRTESELKICVDEEMADIRDYLFFARLVDGIVHRQQRLGATESSWRLRQETDVCLANIIGTRSGCLDINCQNPVCVNTRGGDIDKSKNDGPPAASCGNPSRGQQWINETDEIFEMDM